MNLFQFGDLVGNRNVLTPLTNLIAKDRLPNFDIFGGEFGMGKSTAALITAMRVTCEKPRGFEPCLQCGVCQANMKLLPTEGKSMYVHRIDMSKIETAKQMEDLVNNIFSQRGIAGKIAYILEEFQSLRDELQTKVLDNFDRQDSSIYIFITCTDLHKILDTIKSRTVPFVFSRFNAEESKILTVRECQRLGMGNPSVGFIDLVIRSSKGVARNITKIVEFAHRAELNEDTLRDFLGEVPIPVYIMLLDLILKDESLALNHLEASLIKYPIESFVLGYKSFVERLIFLRKTGTSAYFTDEEGELLKSYREADVSRVLLFASRLPNKSNATDIRLHFLQLLETLRGKTVIEANSTKVSEQVRVATEASIENRSMEYGVESSQLGKTQIASFEKPFDISTLRGYKNASSSQKDT